ncbi:septum formation initiator family protein [Candidatus Gracilibacteria bacterium]|nr:septum formation initiator family protein [Candidatus Gracilibacteria bacterium]
MRNKNEVYSSKNVISLVVVFCVLFWLLYSIGSFLHESKKIDDEIEMIRETNVSLQHEIKEKNKEIAYLKTPQRVEKEAKIQMGKKREGENVLVFVEERLPMLPTERKQAQAKKILTVENWKKWRWIFLGENVQIF